MMPGQMEPDVIKDSSYQTGQICCGHQPRYRPCGRGHHVKVIQTVDPKQICNLSFVVSGLFGSAVEQATVNRLAGGEIPGSAVEVKRASKIT